jgi:hypothetical protein
VQFSERPLGYQGSENLLKSCEMEANRIVTKNSEIHSFLEDDLDKQEL